MRIFFNESHQKIPFSSSTLENLVFVDVLLHGQLIPMIFDTGATMTVISSSISSLVEAKSTGEIIKGGGNSGKILTAEKRIIDSLSLGPATIEDLSVMVLPDENLVFCPDDSNKKIQVYGFLGWDVISRICWHLDMLHKTIVMEESNKYAPKPQNLLWDQMPIIEITHKEDTLFFGLDTGNTNTVLTNQEYYIQERPFFTKEVIQGIDGQFVEEVLKLDSFSFSFDNTTYQLNNLSILNRPIFPTTKTKIHGLFGIDLLKNKIITLDFSNQSLKIEDSPLI